MTDEGRMLLRKKDLVEALGVAKSTVADWVSEFQVFIPTVKEGNITYYKPEAIQVLQAIRELRDQNHSKPEIYTMLQNKGFAVTVEEAADEVSRLLVQVDARKSLIDVMQKVGIALERIADQEDAIQFIEKRQDTLAERQDEQDGRVTDLERMVAELKNELDAARKEIASTKVELSRKKSWWKFGR